MQAIENVIEHEKKSQIEQDGKGNTVFAPGETASASMTMSLLPAMEDIEINKENKTRILPLTLCSQDGQEQVEDSDRDRILTIFFQCDTDSNGFVSRDEFAIFLKMLAEIDEYTSNLVFDILDSDHNGSVSFDEFYACFVGTLLHHPTDETNEMMAISEDEQDEHYQKRLDRNNLLVILQKIENGENHNEHQNFFSGPVENHVRKLFQETDSNNLAEYLRKRWKSFNNFKRAGQSGEIVMTGSKNDVVDILPGNYILSDIAGVKMHGGKIEPRRAIFKNIIWDSGKEAGKPGQLILPTDYDGSIPVDIGTRENLAYYGCHIADDNQSQVRRTLGMH